MDGIRVNGNQIGWGSIIVKVDGERFYGWTAISYSDKRTRGKTHGMGKSHAARGRTRGKYQTDPVKLVGPLTTSRALIEYLAEKSPDGVSFGDSEFEILTQYVEDDGTSEIPIDDEIQRCVVDGVSVAPSESEEAVSEELTIDTMRIKRNGKTLFSSENG